MFSVLLTIFLVILLAEITKKISVMDSPASDEEIFFGRQTLKEVKRRIFPMRQTFSGIGLSQDEDVQNFNDAFTIIQTRSEPDLMSESAITFVESPTDVPISIEDSPTGPDPKEYTVNFDQPLVLDDSVDTLEKDLQNMGNETPQDSFLKIENLVTDLGNGMDDLDNTLEIVEFILNNGLGNSASVPNNTPLGNNSRQIFPTDIQGKCYDSSENYNLIDLTSPNDEDSTTIFTPIKVVKQESVDFKNFLTPLKETNQQTPIFKTPAIPKSEKKIGSSAKKNKNNYQNIASPVASYIKKSPQVPLLKEVKPKKPLPSTSSIPKLVRSQCTNKENVNLPTLAYKSAKTTKMIDIPDKDKMPKSQWANKIATSLPRRVVIKHNHREKNFNSRPEKEDGDSRESFGDLSLQQADVSVCTQKSAFVKR